MRVSPPPKTVGKHFVTKYTEHRPKYGKIRFPILRRLQEKSRVSAYFRVTLLHSEVTPAGFCEGMGLLVV